MNAFCEACPNRPASPNHVMQECDQSFGQRVTRHNYLVNKISQFPNTNNFNVKIEPIIPTRGTFCKPDIMAVKSNTAYIIDIAIFNTNANPDVMYTSKVDKYSDLIDTDTLKSTTGNGRVVFGAVVFNWRGALSQKSLRFWTEKLHLKSKLNFLSNCSSSVLLGGLNVWHQFNTSSFISALDDD